MNASTAEKQPPNTGDIIAEMASNRDERKGHEDVVKNLNARWKELEFSLMDTLDEQGMTKASTGIATATISEQIVPQIESWEDYWKAVWGFDEITEELNSVFHADVSELVERLFAESKFHLLQRRPAAAAFRELHDLGEEVPGAVAYTKRSISLRKST